MSELILVRHAMPDVEPDTDPSNWKLSVEGRIEAQRLAGVLREHLRADGSPDHAASPRSSMLPLLVASAEPKARQTIEPLGAVAIDVRFNEVARDEPFGPDFREVRAAYLGGVHHPRWEPQADVAARFGAGIAEWSVTAGDRPLVVATHGMGMTIWLASIGAMPDHVAFWRALSFPDAWRIPGWRAAPSTTRPLPIRLARD